MPCITFRLALDAHSRIYRPFKSAPAPFGPLQRPSAEADLLNRISLKV